MVKVRVSVSAPLWVVVHYVGFLEKTEYRYIGCYCVGCYDVGCYTGTKVSKRINSP